MSLSSETSSVPSSFKGKDHRSPSVIAAFNKRRLQGDYGTQPNAPSVGLKTGGSDANTSAVKATGSKLGPKLWQPSSAPMAAGASTLASSSSSSYIPDASFVPKNTNDASKAATSAIAIPGEDYGAKYQPDAYKWGNAPRNSITASQRALAQSGTMTADSLNEKNPNEMDISKVLVQAQKNAQTRLANADNHLPANFGIQTPEQKEQRRQQVLSLITIADQRVKDQLSQLDRDANRGQVFASVDYQKIAMEISAKRNAHRLDNFGKTDLGGGLYMTQDEIDDIARRHVQPVLDKVDLIAQKKRVADREHAEREAQLREIAAQEKEKEKQRKAAEKQLAAEEKQRRKQQENDAKTKADRASKRSQQQHPEGSHLWHWQQVEILKDDVKETKAQREEYQDKYNRTHKQLEQTKEDLAAVIERHHELKRDYFGKGGEIDEKVAGYDDKDAETASLFSLKQRRETVKVSTLNAKSKRAELEAEIERLTAEEETYKTEADEAAEKHHELKKQYFEERAIAEEEQRKFDIEEEARLKREAEERAKREAEEAKVAADNKAKADAEAQQKRDAKAAAKDSKKSTGGATTGGAAAGASAGASAGAAAGASSSGAAKPQEDPLPADFKMPAKSQLLDMGNARSGPILSGYKYEKPKPQAPKAEAPKAEESKAEEPKAEASKTEEPKTEAPKAEESKAEESKAEEPKVEAPKTETPKAEESKIETPKAEAPKTETPKTETPKAEAPKVEAPKVETPKVETPKAEAPKAEAPKAETEAPKAAAAAAPIATPKEEEKPSNTIVEDTNLKTEASDVKQDTPASGESSRSGSEEPAAAVKGDKKADKKAQKKAQKKAEKTERLAKFSQEKAESNRKAEAIRKAEEEKRASVLKSDDIDDLTEEQKKRRSDQAEAEFDRTYGKFTEETTTIVHPSGEVTQETTTIEKGPFSGFDSSNVKEQVQEGSVFKEDI